ncbi:MAG: threonine synthase [Bacteroidota bacterium]
MKLYSTNSSAKVVDIKEAVFKSLPADRGLYMPCEIPRLDKVFIKTLKQHSFQSIAFEVCKALFQDRIPDDDLKVIVERAITFPAPVIPLKNNHYILELFHGPSLAFKDFGARFMAQLMSYFLRGEDRKLTILVATSGDTGGAVASGFYETDGIEVIILYPSGKVSDLQEKQLTTLGKNITALEIDGTFDDCQALVKQAFLDESLNKKYNLSSANSINIARLIPQSFYYFEAYKQVTSNDLPIAFCVPSGNFGNLTAGLLAQKMGLPINQFIAATNINDVVPQYLSSGDFHPKPSKSTISNAMDVGNPSNFVRMLDLHGSTWNTVKDQVVGYAVNDGDTRETIQTVYEQEKYVLCPHTAVGYRAAQRYQSSHSAANVVTLGTAHPSKFIDVVEETIQARVVVPERLAALADRKKVSTELGIGFDEFKFWLMDR